MPDATLSAIASGRPDAVDDCIRKFSGPIWSLARRMTPNQQDAEDTVQDIFLDIWKSAGRYDPSLGSELTFVMTIARRRLIDRIRAQGRAPACDSLSEPQTLPADEAVDMAQVADEIDRVNAAMADLRPEQREVLEFSLVHGQTHQQVAERTGMPLGTVKSHARRGLMRVRESLGVDTPESKGGDA